jgi:hypothetical protein
VKIVLAIVAVVAGAALLLWQAAVPVLPPGIPKGIPHGIPIAVIAGGRVEPRIGLMAPLPRWMPLPDRGLVIGAGIYPPQPPFGAAAVVMLKLDESQEAFAASYAKQLEHDGFSVRRLPTPFNLIVDRPDGQFEANERKSGRAIYVTLRATHFAQLTFWDSPAPRMP